MQQTLCVRGKKNTEKKTRSPAAPNTHLEIHSNSATATTSRRRATKHVPRVSPYSPASIDLGFVEIGLVQLSQSVKPRMLMLHIDRQDRETTNSYIMQHCCTHPGTSREVNEARRPHSCSRRCAFEEKTRGKKNEIPCNFLTAAHIKRNQTRK